MKWCLNCQFYRALLKAADESKGETRATAFAHGHCYASPPVVMALPVPVPVHPTAHIVRAAQANRRGESQPPEVEYTMQPVSLRANVKEMDTCRFFAVRDTGPEVIPRQ